MAGVATGTDTARQQAAAESLEVLCGSASEWVVLCHGGCIERLEALEDTFNERTAIVDIRLVTARFFGRETCFSETGETIDPDNNERVGALGGGGVAGAEGGAQGEVQRVQRDVAGGFGGKAGPLLHGVGFEREGHGILVRVERLGQSRKVFEVAGCA